MPNTALLLPLALTLACSSDKEPSDDPTDDTGFGTWSGQDLGGTDSGGATDGGTDSGGTTDGGTDSGGSTDGGTTDGGTDSGGTSDGGASDSGATGDICSDPDLSATTIDIDETCVEWEGGTLSLVEEWTQLDGYETLAQAVVGQLTDDDGDGSVGDGDVPDIVIVTFENEAVAMSGADGTVHWVEDLGGGGFSVQPVLADVDGDGEVEVLVAGLAGGIDRTIYSLDGATGATEWSTDLVDVPYNAVHASLAVADLDGDGRAEVTLGPSILDGLTGELLVAGSEGSTGNFSCEVGYTADRSVQSLPFDLDRDGQQELVVGNRAFDVDGELAWSNARSDGAVAVANFDEDPEAEVVVLFNWTLCADSGSEVRLQEDDGMVIWSVVGDFLSSGNPPVIADFDGDGGPEIALVHNTYDGGYRIWWRMLDADGSELWAVDFADYGYAGMTGMSAADLDGDGAYELIQRSADTLSIIDGATGVVMASAEDLGPSNGYGHPVVADVDADGSAEIVVTGYDAFSDEGGVYVYGAAEGDWPAAGTVWNQYGWSVTNIGPDLSVPAAPTPNWPRHNSFRAADTPTPTALDLTVTLTQLCETECSADTLRAVVQVGNEGTETIEAGVSWAVEGQVDGTWSILAEGTTEVAIAPGETTPGIAVEVSASAATEGLRAIVDGGEYLRGDYAECSNEDNVALLEGPFCE